MKFFNSIFGGKTPDEKPSAKFSDEYYKQKSKESADTAWNLLHSADWKLEKQTKEGDTVHSTHLPGVGKVYKLIMLDESTDIIYQITAPSAGGLLSTRDFVWTRHYSVRDGCFCSGGVSIEHPEAPVNEKHVRGENGPSCIVAIPIPGVADRCILQWVVNTRLNGWLPQYLVDMAFTEGVLLYLKYVRAYGEQLREQGLMDK